VTDSSFVVTAKREVSPPPVYHSKMSKRPKPAPNPLTLGHQFQLAQSKSGASFDTSHLPLDAEHRTESASTLPDSTLSEAVPFDTSSADVQSVKRKSQKLQLQLDRVLKEQWEATASLQSLTNAGVWKALDEISEVKSEFAALQQKYILLEKIVKARDQENGILNKRVQDLNDQLVLQHSQITQLLEEKTDRENQAFDDTVNKKVNDKTENMINALLRTISDLTGSESR
jgi:hypothetical protein